MNKKPRVNPGFGYGQMLYRPADAEQRCEAEDGPMTPQEKGEFRKSYWRGVAAVRGDSLMHCLRYMRMADVVTLVERLEALYWQTLVDMYGEEEAGRFLDEIETSLGVERRKVSR